MYTIASSTGITLQFPDNVLLQAYKAAQHDLEMLFYARIRAKYGIWAGNQGKFVTDRSDLNDWDRTYMEDFYLRWVAVPGNLERILA